MAKIKGVCARCGRERYTDRMGTVGGASWSGAPLRCVAKTSCKLAAKRRRAAAR